MKTFTGYNSS